MLLSLCDTIPLIAYSSPARDMGFHDAEAQGIALGYDDVANGELARIVTPPRKPPLVTG